MKASQSGAGRSVMAWWDWTRAAWNGSGRSGFDRHGISDLREMQDIARGERRDLAFAEHAFAEPDGGARAQVFDPKPALPEMHARLRIRQAHVRQRNRIAARGAHGRVGEKPQHL